MKNFFSVIIFLAIFFSSTLFSKEKKSPPSEILRELNQIIKEETQSDLSKKAQELFQQALQEKSNNKKSKRSDDKNFLFYFHKKTNQIPTKNISLYLDISCSHCIKASKRVKNFLNSQDRSLNFYLYPLLSSTNINSAAVKLTFYYERLKDLSLEKSRHFFFSLMTKKLGLRPYDKEVTHKLLLEVGLTQKDANKILSQEVSEKWIRKALKRYDDWNIKVTPTYVINGKEYLGNIDFTQKLK